LAPAILCFTLRTGAQASTGEAGFEFKLGQSVYVLAVKTAAATEHRIHDQFWTNLIALQCGSVDKRFGKLTTWGPNRGLVSNRTLEVSDLMGSPMISTDPLLKTSIEDAFRNERSFKVAEAAESSDFVFFAFSVYPDIGGVTPPSSPGQAPTRGRMGEPGWGKGAKAARGAKGVSKRR
jgi:hypothetical protein